MPLVTSPLISTLCLLLHYMMFWTIQTIYFHVSSIISSYGFLQDGKNSHFVSLFLKYLWNLQAEAGCLSICAELPRCASLVIFSSSCSFSPVQKLARMLFVFSPAPLAIPVCPVCLAVKPLTLEYCCQIITNNPRSI